MLLASTRPWGGLIHQAVAAVENACLDIHAKAPGVPVFRPVRRPQMLQSRPRFVDLSAHPGVEIWVPADAGIQLAAVNS
jgi:L-alanine-DL-glutamate epimerase-like enolase superfamily enzyme